MKEGKLNDSKLGELNYKIGTNAKENWKLIDESKQNDIWFHLDDYPSSHVVLSLPENITFRHIAKQSLIHCANECKKHSSMKNSHDKITVIYTPISNVTKATKEGSVTTSNTQKLVI